MASDSILKLKVDDKEYEKSLRYATKGLQALESSLRTAGKSFNDVDKNVEAYVRELGKMDAVAKTSKGRISEMSSAFIELSQVEKRLTEQERQSPVGKALTESLDALRQRTIAAKNELSDLSSQLNEMKPASIGDTGGGMGDALSGLTGKFTMGNLYAEAAMKGVEAVEALGQKIVETTRRGMELSVQAEGIQHAFNRLNQPNLLDNLKEATHGTVSELNLMKAAVQFNNFKLPVEELGTMLAFAQQKAKDTGQSVDYMVDSIVTGLGRKSLMILDNLGLSAAQIKEKMKDTGDMTKAVGEIIREEMANAGDYTETASDRMARAMAENEDALRKLGDQLRETFGDTSWEEFTTKLSTEWVKAEGDIIRGLDKISDYMPLLIGLKEAFSAAGVEAEDMFSNIVDWAMVCTGPLGTVIELIRQIGKESKTAGDYMIDAARSMVNAIVYSSLPFGHSKTPVPHIPTTTTSHKTGGGKTTLSPAAQAEADMAKAEKQYHQALANAQEKVNVGLMTEEELQKTKLRLLEQLAEKNLAAWNTTGLDKYLTTFTNFANAAVDLRDKLMSVDDVFKQLEKDFPSSITSGLESQSWAESMQSAYAGDKGFGNEEDTSNFIRNLIQKGIENGVDVSGAGATLMEKLFEGMEIPDEQLQAFVDLLNRKLAEIGVEPIKIDIDTKKVIDGTKEMTKDWQKASSAIQTVGSAMSQIEDPAAKVMGTIAQAIATVALSFSQALATPKDPWSWIAFAATGTATMIATISAIKSNAKFAEGGIVKGNSYSGDNILMPIDGGRGGFAGLNAGEVVLNASQQNMLAQNLTNNGGEISDVRPYTTGENIILGINTHFRRSGQGEIVTTSMLRRMGLI